MVESNTALLTSVNDYSHIKYDELSRKLDSYSKCIKELNVIGQYVLTLQSYMIFYYSSYRGISKLLNILVKVI